MDADRWRLVEDLFNRSLEVPAAERRRFLESATSDAEIVREVCSLLESDGGASTEFVKDSVRVAAAEIGSEAEGTRAGPYLLIRELGRGGMGAVWLARRADEQYDKEVAIKLVREGMDTDFVLARFRRERQILAQLEHPNIARLLDGGTTESGLPYIVMEYVKGTWITAYCEENRLPLADRVRLFLPVCEAVDYAHRTFVVHRDLKPGNILVNEQGVPKLLDFGISKLLMASPLSSGDTIAEDLRMLTPDFASPEQVLGDPVTVASDIYSLGAVLYRVLTGTLPHRIEKYTPRELERAICETDVPKASSRVSDPALAKEISGDLDTILARALQKDPARRYPSAEAFAADLRGFLEFRPISARPDTIFYRFGKFTRRNRIGVAAGTAVACALTGAAVISFRQAGIARANLEQTRRLANSLITEIYDSVKDLPGATRARQNIVKVSVEYLDGVARQNQSDPELDRELASAYLRTAEIQGYALRANLGDTKGAIASFRHAVSLLERYASRNPGNEGVQAELVGVRQKLGDTLHYSEGTRAAVAEYQKGIDEVERWIARHQASPKLRETVGDLYSSLARVQRLAQDDRPALQNAAKAIAMFRETRGAKLGNESERSLASALSSQGLIQVRLGQPEAALASLREAVSILDGLAATDPSNINYQRNLMLAHSHLAELLTEHRSLPGAGTAEEALQRVVTIARALHNADPHDQRALGDMGIALMRWGRGTRDPELALARLREAEARLAEAGRANPSNLVLASNWAMSVYLVGKVLAAKSPETASRQYRMAITMAEAILDKDRAQPGGHAALLTASAALARISDRNGDRAGATALLDKAKARAVASEDPKLMAKADKAREEFEGGGK